EKRFDRLPVGGAPRWSVNLPFATPPNDRLVRWRVRFVIDGRRCARHTGFFGDAAKRRQRSGRLSSPGLRTSPFGELSGISGLGHGPFAKTAAAAARESISGGRALFQIGPAKPRRVEVSGAFRGDLFR